MPRGNSLTVFKRDTLVFIFLREHKWEENKVNSEEIKKFLCENGYSTKKEHIHSIVRKVMYDRNAPICSSNAKGYYWAKSRDELEMTISDLESRRNSLQEHIDHLKGFMI